MRKLTLMMVAVALTAYRECNVSAYTPLVVDHKRQKPTKKSPPCIPARRALSFMNLPRVSDEPPVAAHMTRIRCPT
jgi:hypothetical protein